MIWAGRVACMGEKINECGFLVGGKLKEREYVEEEGVDRNDNFNIDLKE